MRQTLNAQEEKVLSMLAKGRSALKNPDRPAPHLNDIELVDWMGIVSEYVVARYLKIPFDTSMLIGGDDGVDMYLGDWPIQVKATSTKESLLIFNQPEDLKLINVLVRIHHSEIDILGYISDRDFRKNMYVHNFGHGARFCVKPNNLSPIENLTFYFQEFQNKFVSSIA